MNDPMEAMERAAAAAARRSMNRANRLFLVALARKERSERHAARDRRRWARAWPRVRAAGALATTAQASARKRTPIARVLRILP